MTMRKKIPDGPLGRWQLAVGTVPCFKRTSLLEMRRVLIAFCVCAASAGCTTHVGDNLLASASDAPSAPMPRLETLGNGAEPCSNAIPITLAATVGEGQEALMLLGDFGAEIDAFCRNVATKRSAEFSASSIDALRELHSSRAECLKNFDDWPLYRDTCLLHDVALLRALSIVAVQDQRGGVMEAGGSVSPYLQELRALRNAKTLIGESCYENCSHGEMLEAALAALSEEMFARLDLALTTGL